MCGLRPSNDVNVLYHYTIFFFIFLFYFIFFLFLDWFHSIPTPRNGGTICEWIIDFAGCCVENAVVQRQFVRIIRYIWCYSSTGICWPVNGGRSSETIGWKRWEFKNHPPAQCNVALSFSQSVSVFDPSLKLNFRQFQTGRRSSTETKTSKAHPDAPNNETIVN